VEYQCDEIHWCVLGVKGREQRQLDNAINLAVGHRGAAMGSHLSG